MPDNTLQQRLTDDMKAAMKAGEKDRLQVIRMLLSDVKNVDLQSKPTTPEQAVDAYAKKLRKSVEEYEKLGKPDEVAKLKQEIGVVEQYLPKKASAEETEKLVDAFLAGNAFTEKQVGQATGAFMKAHGQQVEAGIANALLRKKLAGK
ncbi:MAG TPA: GatB/YqeY domain-containing protein [Tepidisphaeraceae bacterium]|nr:GatB/YqeY domain-containing protein [Tepidisphaeraceae bacterium]